MIPENAASWIMQTYSHPNPYGRRDEPDIIDELETHERIDGQGDDWDALLLVAADLCVASNKASADTLAKALAIPRKRVSKLLEQLKTIGVLGPHGEVLVDKETLDAMIQG